MPDYEVVIAVRIPIRARNDRQADERAQQMLAWLRYQPPAGKPWTKPRHALQTEVDYVSLTP